MEQVKQKKTILIIDDDKDLLSMYSVKFREGDFEVIEAFGGVDALSKLREGVSPDAVILDVVMPSINGFELLSLIKGENLASQAKVIMLSNLGQPEDIEKGRSLGANGYIIKASATPAEVVEKVLLVLNGQEVFAVVD